jgi:hypothetical protein
MLRLKTAISMAAVAAMFAALLAPSFAVAGAPPPDDELVIDQVTVDGGATTIVAPSDTIEVIVTASSGENGPDWDCTDQTVEGQSSVKEMGVAETAPFSGETHTFNITAPAVVGTYDLDIEVHSNNGCGSFEDSATLTDAIIVQVALPPGTVKSLISGPTDGAGNLIDLDGIFGLGLGGPLQPDPDSNDDGVIGVGLGVDGIGTGDDQHYVFRIEITDLPDGTVIYDVVPAEYNLDPTAQEDAADGTPDGNCTDATCDGDDGVPLTGISVTGGVCTATPRQPPSADVKDERFKEPELITIVVGDGGGGDFSCTVDVFVVTDGNPGHYTEPSGPFTLWEPTSCLAFLDENDELLEDGSGGPIVDSIALNDGLKEYDPVTGDRLSGPIGSLQLTPVGCDSDEDGVIDELDLCPVDGPTTVDVDEDGCED